MSIDATAFDVVDLNPQTSEVGREPDRIQDKDAQAGTFVRAFYQKVGLAGLAVLLGGASLAIACTIWAVLAGVSYPLAIMVGYCALACSVGACAALGALQQHARSEVRIEPPAEVEPLSVVERVDETPAESAAETVTATDEPPPAVVLDVFAPWRLVSQLSVSDASRLWCDVQPGAAATQESVAWGRAMLDAIKRGDLTIVDQVRPGSNKPAGGRANPDWHTEMTREALRAWADAQGFIPRFLAPAAGA